MGLSELTLHHIGVVTRSIKKELPVFALLGYRGISGIFTEPGQKVRGMFIGAPGQPTLELLENAGTPGPLDASLRRGVKFYHFAYSVPDVEAELGNLLASCRAKVVIPVTRSEYFHKLCFVMLPNMMLVEFVEPRRMHDGLSFPLDFTMV